METHRQLWQEQMTPEQIAACWPNRKSSAGAAARVADGKGLHGQLLDRVDVGMEMDTPDSRCRATLDLYLEMLARSMAQVINILDPHTIVLGGGLSSISCLYDELPRRIPPYLFSREACASVVLPPLGGPASGVYGAAYLD